MLCVCACVYILISPFYPPYQVSRFWSHRRGHWSQEEFSYMLEFTQRLTKLGSKLRPIWFPVPCAFYHSLLPFPRSESSFSIPFNWRWRQNRIFNFNYKEAKKTVFLPAYNTSILYHWHPVGFDSQHPLWNWGACKPWAASKRSPETTETLASQSRIMDLPALFLLMLAVPLLGLTNNHLEKGRTELERMPWIWRSLSFNLPKNLCVVQTMSKLAIWEPSLGTYLHLSPHLGGKHYRIIVVFRLVGREKSPLGSKLILNTCLCFWPHNMVTNDGSANRLGKINGWLQRGEPQWGWWASFHLH